MHEDDGSLDEASPHLWIAFGDLMACLFGLLVLIFVGVICMQVALAEDLEAERASNEQVTARLETLERLLAGPLEAGLISIEEGRIGIRGSVLFDRASADLRPEGRRLLHQLAPPLGTYLEQRDQSLMISGYTDDLPVRAGSPYRDNWELSTQRALTVVREMVFAGLDSDRLVAAGFGESHPAASNETEEGRVLNRRVEIAPIPGRVSASDLQTNDEDVSTLAHEIEAAQGAAQ